MNLTSLEVNEKKASHNTPFKISQTLSWTIMKETEWQDVSGDKINL